MLRAGGERWPGLESAARPIVTMLPLLARRAALRSVA